MITSLVFVCVDVCCHLQGYPYQRIDSDALNKVSEAFLFGLAGNGYAATVIEALSMAALGAVEHWNVESEDRVFASINKERCFKQNVKKLTLGINILWGSNFGNSTNIF